MNQSKPVIFICNFHPFISRNLFDSGAVKKIAEGSKDLYVFVLKHKEVFLKTKYDTENVHIVGIDLDSEITETSEILTHRIAELLLNTNTKKLHQRIYRDRGGSLAKYLLSRIVMSFFGNLSFLRRAFRKYVLMRLQPNVFDHFFEKYKPDLTVVTDPFSPHDTILMKAARRNRSKLVAILRSWDNFTTKEYLEILPDAVLVQNEEMIQEGRLLHDIPTERFRLIGVPQFEYYMSYTPIPRDVFCREMNLDPKKDIILYSPAGDKFSDSDWQICEILKQLAAQKKFVRPVQFLIRLHPMNPTDLSRFDPSPDFVIDDPRVALKGRNQKEAEMGLKEVNHLADSLYHSRVVINVVSSLLIDAAVFDKPVVTVSFDGWEKNVPLVRSVLAEQANEWMQVLLDKKLSPRAHSAEELLSYINLYLEDPMRDKERREFFVKEHCWKLDGKTPERIAAHVLESAYL